MECFVTQIEAAVNNDNLPVWKQIPLLLLKNTDGHSTKFAIANSNSKDITVTCDENGLFDNNQRSVVLKGGTGTVNYTLTGNSVVKIQPYDSLIKLVTGSTAVSSGTGNAIFLAEEDTLTYLPYLEEFSIRTLSTLHQLDVCPNLKYLGLQNSTGYSSSEDGNIAILGSHIQLLYVYTINSVINGALEDLALAQVTAGRTSGKIGVHCNGRITYNGATVAKNTYKYIHYNSAYTGGYQITDSSTPPTP